jgi:hemolysin activation/secretion protein
MTGSAMRGPRPEGRRAATVRMAVLTMTTAVLTATPLEQPAFAQSALERNLPEAVAPGGGAVTLGEPDYGEGGSQPLGVDLAGVRLIGAGEAPSATPPRGISIGAVPDAAPTAIEAALGAYLGQPLTPDLIVRMQGAVARVWREAGYPFVSVTVPPQEITSGVLSLRVVEFHAGQVHVEGGSALERNLPPAIRLAPGQRIDAGAVEEDLDWLNRNPYRRVEGVFAPGDETGSSDFTLKVTRDKPWSVFGSYANAGSEATGRDRWSVGGGAWIPDLNDMTLSYRFTRSGEIWHDGDLTSLDLSRPGYLSHAARIDIPTWSRQALSIAPNYVETNELVSGTPFSFNNTTFELPILYRTAISNIFPGRYLGDLYFGGEPKWLSRKTRFAGIEVGRADAGLVNLVVGWSHQFTDPYGRTGMDLRLKANPGGITGNNTAADWSAFTGGRVSDHTYVYAAFDVSRFTTLPYGLGWASTASGQIATQVLPDTERLGLGGYYAVRGYDGDDASADTGLFWRNELRLPTLSPLANMGIADSLSPFALLDLGVGRDNAARIGTSLAGAGFGLEYAIGRNVNLGVVAALALTEAGATHSGDWSVNADLRFTY